jgi:hypothetical protein
MVAAMSEESANAGEKQEGESVASGWLSLGLGVFDEVKGAVATGDNGVFVTCGSMSYRLPDSHVSQGSESTFPVIEVEVLETHIPDYAAGEDGMVVNAPCSATIACTGYFKPGDEHHPPALDNVQLWCSRQTGNWGTGRSESELHFSADGQPTPVGSPENPLLEYRCRLELKIPEWDNVIMHITTHINSLGFPTFETPVFEYGQCDAYPMGPWLNVTYDANKHATRDGAHL